MNETISILLVEDDPAYARLLLEMLGGAGSVWRIAHAGTLEDALHRLEEPKEFEAILLDLGLPDADGLEALHAIRSAARRHPIVVLSGQDDFTTAIECMRQGAQEYVVKGQAEAHLIPRAIRYAIERKRQQEFEQLLVGIVSHDLRGPLHVIQLALELVLGDASSERVAQVVRRGQRATQRATALVGDLLDVTRSRAGGQMRLATAETDLLVVLDQVVDEQRTANPGREFNLSVAGPTKANCDAKRMAQVFSNLLGNALQHSPPESKVDVALLCAPESIIFSTHNSGPPIPEELNARLFEPLERAELQKKNPGTSIGLGLYIVREIVVAHGGSIEVESTEATGTRFRVTIPRGQ